MEGGKAADSLRKDDEVGSPYSGESLWTSFLRNPLTLSVNYWYVRIYACEKRRASSLLVIDMASPGPSAAVPQNDVYSVPHSSQKAIDTEGTINTIRWGSLPIPS